MLATRAEDVVDTAEEIVNSNTGIQEKLGTTLCANNYEAMGYRGGYWYAPTVYGYLQRKTSAYSVNYQLRFELTKGTKAAIAAAAVYEVLKGTPWSQIAMSVILNTILAVYGAIIDAIETGEYQIRTYRWDYRVRLNSDTGTIMGTDYRTKTYSRVFSPSTGRVNYQYNGNTYDGGFPLSNTEMIKANIDEYLER